MKIPPTGSRGGGGRLPYCTDKCGAGAGAGILAWLCSCFYMSGGGLMGVPVWSFLVGSFALWTKAPKKKGQFRSLVAAGVCVSLSRCRSLACTASWLELRALPIGSLAFRFSVLLFFGRGGVTAVMNGPCLVCLVYWR